MSELLITESRFYHKAKDHKYNGALCGADVHWTRLAMNDEMVACKRCQKLERKREADFQHLVDKIESSDALELAYHRIHSLECLVADLRQETGSAGD